jgi:hypothetical protein
MYEPLQAEKVPEMIEKLQMKDRSIGLVEFQSEKSLALSQGDNKRACPQTMFKILHLLRQRCQMKQGCQIKI